MMKLFSFSESIRSANAHTKNDQYEPFTKHVERTEYYLDKLLKIHDLNEVLLKMLGDMGASVDSQKLLDYIKQIIAYHDIGKLTDQFQRKLQGAKITVSHSDVGFFIILVKLLYDMCIEKQLSGEEFKTLFVLSTVVHRHHSHLCDINEFYKLTSEYNRKKSSAHQIIEKYIDKEKENLLQTLERVPDLNVKRIIKFKEERKVTLFFLYKTINSLLLSADYFATMEFEAECGFQPKIINRDIVEKLNGNVSNREVKGNFNYYIDTNFDQLLAKCANLNEISSLNELRSIIAVRSERSLLEKIRDNRGNVFFLEVPTGGGKTNLALRLVRRLLQKGSYRKVIYVLPYINIIEQNYDYFSRFVSEDIITRLDHTYIRASEKKDVEEFRIYTEQLFMNYPFLFMSHVKFFDMIFESKKSSNYNFYQLANSIVVIDEIQAYKTEYWDLLTQMFHSLARYLNTTFIIMSATLPKFKELLLNTQDKQHFTELLDSDFVEKLYKHRLFDRVELKYVDLAFSENNSEEFANNVLKMSEGKRKVLIVLNSVKESLKLCEAFERITEDFEIYLLNSTILPSRRREILQAVNSDRCGKVILIATQSIEAGVDLDFDIGFRAIAPMDSIVQAMGRVNRHGTKPKASLYIFEDTKWKYVYKNDIRAQVLKENLSTLKSGTIDMNAYYDGVLQKMKSILNSHIVQTAFDFVKELKLGTIASNVKLIDTQTMSLFIPCEIRVQRNVLKWLKERGIASKDKVRGSDVWQYYLNLLESKESFEDLYRIKEFSKILSLFTANVFNYSTERGRIKESLKDELQGSKVYYASDYQEYYSYEKGLNVEKFVEKKLGREFEII